MPKIYFIGFITSVLAVMGYNLSHADAQDSNSEATDSTAVQRVANLSGNVQIQEGEAVVQKAENLSKRVSDMLAEARRESDIIRINCLNDKLTQINANLRNATSRLTSIKEATDPSRRDHDYTVLMVLKQKFQTLDQEANQCVGQDIFELGATQVTSEVDPDAIGEGEQEVPSQPPSIPPSIITYLPEVTESSGWR